MAIEYHRLNALAHQNIGTRQPRRPGTDNRHPLAAADNIADIRPPAFGQRTIGDIAFNITDGHCTVFVTDSTSPFAESVLRANAAGNLRQRVGLMRQLHRRIDIASVHPRNPLWNMVVQRAGPFADAVLAAAQAARGGLLSLIFTQRQIDFAKTGFTFRQVEFISFAARGRLRHLLHLAALRDGRYGPGIAMPRLRFATGRLQTTGAGNLS